MTVTETPPAPLSIENIIRRITLDAASAGKIQTARTKIDAIMAIITGTEPDRNGRTSQLHLEADVIESEFHADPTFENAERFHRALVRNETARISFARIDTACHVHLDNASKALAPVALEVIDQAIAMLDGEASRTRAALVKTASVFSDDGETQIFDSRLAVTRAHLEAERDEAQASPLSWLTQRGF